MLQIARQIFLESGGHKTKNYEWLQRRIQEERRIPPLSPSPNGNNVENCIFPEILDMRTKIKSSIRKIFEIISPPFPRGNVESFLDA